MFYRGLAGKIIFTLNFCMNIVFFATTCNHCAVNTYKLVVHIMVVAMIANKSRKKIPQPLLKPFIY